MPAPTQTTNLLYACSADMGAFSDAAGLIPAVVGGPVRRINNLGSAGGQITVNFPEELKLGQDNAQNGGRKYFTNANTHNANSGGDLIVAANGLSGPRTFVLFFRTLASNAQVLYADFGATGFDALLDVNNAGEVRCQLQVKPGLSAPYLPANALQFLALSIDASGQAKSYVNGLLRSTFDASGLSFSRLWVSCANLRMYMPLVYGQAADAALLTALQTDARAINIQPTHERLGHSYDAAQGAGASSIYQCLSNRVFETLRALLTAAPTPSNPIFINHAIGGRNDAQVKAQLAAEVSVASPALGPVVCTISGVTNTAARPGSVADGQAAADAYLSVTDAAKLKAYDAIYGTLPAFTSFGLGVMEAIHSRVLANLSGSVQAFTKVFDNHANPARAVRSNGALLDGILPDKGLHENNNEHSMDASAQCPDIAAVLVGYMPAPQQAIALAKKPVPSAPVISSDRLKIRITHDMPLAVRNPTAYGSQIEQDGSVTQKSAVLSQSMFQNDTKQDGSPNPIAYPAEYQQITGYSLTGAGAITITNAVTPPDDITATELTLSSPLPAAGAALIRLQLAQNNNVLNHLGNAVAAYSVQLVAGPQLTAIILTVDAPGTDGTRAVHADPVPSNADLGALAWVQTGGGTIVANGANAVSTPPAQAQNAQSVAITTKSGTVTGVAAYAVNGLPIYLFTERYLRGPLNAEFQYGDETCGVGDAFDVILKLTDGDGQPVALAPETPIVVTVSANGQTVTEDGSASIEHGPSGLVRYALQAADTETAGRKQITVTIGGPGNRQSFGPCGLNVKAA